MSSFRFVRGHTQLLELPALTNDAVVLGDLLYFDTTNNAVRPASTVAGGDYAAKKTNLATTFVGVAMTAKAAGVAGNVSVATDGDFVYPCPTGAEYEVTDTVAGGDGSSMVNQAVVKDTTAGNVIGRVIALKPSAQPFVMVRLVSKCG